MIYNLFLFIHYDNHAHYNNHDYHKHYKKSCNYYLNDCDFSDFSVDMYLSILYLFTKGDHYYIFQNKWNDDNDNNNGQYFIYIMIVFAC